METIIINIDANIASAFNVTKNKPINIKGLPTMKLQEKEDVVKFLKILKTKFNIDDFKEIDMTIYLVNQNANKDILKDLRAELENAHNFYESTPENTIELKKKNDAEVKQLNEKLNKLQEKIEKLTKENKSLKEKLKKSESVLQQVSATDDKNTSSEKQEAENLHVPVSEIEKLKEDESRICRVELGTDLVLVHALYFYHEQIRTMNGKKPSLNIKEGDYVEKGDIIGLYNIHSYPNFVSVAEIIIAWDFCFQITAKRFGKIFYFCNNHSLVKPNQIVAVIGEPSWTREDALKFVDDFEKRELSLTKKTETEVEKRIYKGQFGNETFNDSDYNSFHFIKADMTNKYIEEGKEIGRYKIIGDYSFSLKAKCFGKLFYLFRENYCIVSKNPNQIVAVIGEPNWTEKDVINFLEKNNLLSEVDKENLDDTYKNLLKNKQITATDVAVGLGALAGFGAATSVSALKNIFSAATTSLKK